MEVSIVTQSSPRTMPVNGAATTTSAPSTGNSIYKDTVFAVYQLTSAAAATAVIQGSLDNTNWCPVTGTAASSTITLAGAGTGCIFDPTPAAPWRYVRVNVTAATAATTCMMGV